MQRSHTNMTTLKTIAAPTLALCFLFSSLAARAEDPKIWAHESEVALVTTTGNSETESASAKQKTVYTLDSNIYTGTARYLSSKTSGTETARNWDAGLRYERTLSETWGAFVAYLIEADSYSGFVQRNSTDLGGKYILIKNDSLAWIAEAGLRNSDTYTTFGEHVYTNYGRLYTDYKHKLNESVSFGLWAEYLPNFKDSDAYLANGEASVTSILSQVFSLKVAYLGKYQNIPALSSAKRLDTVFTTSLVAKF